MQEIRKKIFDLSKLTEPKTEVFLGVSAIKVELIQYLPNPYKGIVEMALMTWGSTLKKWNCLLPEERFEVVKKVLQRKALPLALESPVFLFQISGITRSSFDQIARQRIGSTFSSIGWNNIHTQTGIRIPNELSNWSIQIQEYIQKGKQLYSEMIQQGVSWQSAREILPIGLIHQFCFNVTYAALQTFCSRRLCFSEKEDTVAVAWLMRERVKEKFPMLASCLRPACDWIHRCIYHNQDSLPEIMGTLFKSCRRNVCKFEGNIEFVQVSTNKQDLENQLNILIPNSEEESLSEKFEILSSIDQELFNAC